MHMRRTVLIIATQNTMRLPRLSVRHVSQPEGLDPSVVHRDVKGIGAEPGGMGGLEPPLEPRNCP